MNEKEEITLEQMNEELGWIFRDVMEVRNIFAKRQLERLKGYIQEP